MRRQQSNKSDRNVIARKLGQLAASDPRQKFKKSYIATKNTARRSGKEIRRVGPVDAAAVFSDESQSIRKLAWGSGIMWRDGSAHLTIALFYRFGIRKSSIVTLSSESRISSLALTLYRGSAGFLVIYGIGSAISFGVHLLMARLLGARSYGYFVYATSRMAILLLGCNLGLKPTVIRFVAAYKARGEWGSLRGLLSRATGWTIAASAAVTTLSAIALWLLRPGFDELGTTLALVALAMPFMALADVWSSAVRGLGAVARSQYPASIVQHVLFGIVLIVIMRPKAFLRRSSSIRFSLILREKIRHRFGRTNVEISTLAPIRQQPIFDTIFKAKRRGGA